jgi:hypothetical protein
MTAAAAVAASPALLCAHSRQLSSAALGPADASGLLEAADEAAAAADVSGGGARSGGFFGGGFGGRGGGGGGDEADLKAADPLTPTHTVTYPLDAEAALAHAAAAPGAETVTEPAYRAAAAGIGVGVAPGGQLDWKWGPLRWARAVVDVVVDAVLKHSPHRYAQTEFCT